MKISRKTKQRWLRSQRRMKEKAARRRTIITQLKREARERYNARLDAIDKAHKSDPPEVIERFR